MITVALVLLVILHAASADSGAKCPEGTTAVDGYPHKCYWFTYYSKPMNIFDQRDVCSKMKPSGRLFTPESKEEMMKVEQAVIQVPTGKVPEGYGIYFVSYTLYAGPSIVKDNRGPFPNLFYYVSFTPPFIFMNSTSEMWAKGEPNGGLGCIDDHHYGECQPVIEASLLIGFPTGQKGLCDIPSSKKKYSVLCEFPSEN